MDTSHLDQQKVARSLVQVFMRHGLTLDQLAALSEPENDIVARRIAEHALLLLGEGAKIAQARADGNYPELAGQMSVWATNMLKRGGVNDVGCLQVLSEGELRDIRNVADKTIEEVRHFLAGQGLRLRFDDEPRRERLLQIFEDPSRIPLSHLRQVRVSVPEGNMPILDYDRASCLEKLGCNYYGDLSGTTRAQLAARERADRRESGPLFPSDVLDAIQDELRYFGLDFAPL